MDGGGARPRYFDLMDDECTTRRLERDQREREQREENLAETTADDREAAQHERRADKAHYLRRKLEERESSERD